MIKSVSKLPAVLGATKVATANKEKYIARILKRSESSQNLYSSLRAAFGSSDADACVLKDVIASARFATVEFKEVTTDNLSFC